MVIRECHVKDAYQLLRMLFELDKETDVMMYDVGERPNNITKLQKKIKHFYESDDLFLVAVDNNNIVGFLEAERGKFSKVKHSAYVIVGVTVSYQGKGIASKFFKELDLWATSNNVTRLEVSVMSNNLGAVAFYEKCGFVIEGVRRNSIFMNGEYIDEYYMAKIF